MGEPKGDSAGEKMPVEPGKREEAGRGLCRGVGKPGVWWAARRMLRTGLVGMKCCCSVEAVELVRARIVVDPSAE